MTATIDKLDAMQKAFNAEVRAFMTAGEHLSNLSVTRGQHKAQCHDPSKCDVSKLFNDAHREALVMTRTAIADMLATFDEIIELNDAAVKEGVV